MPDAPLIIPKLYCAICLFFLEITVFEDLELRDGCVGVCSRCGKEKQDIFLTLEEGGQHDS